MRSQRLYLQRIKNKEGDGLTKMEDIVKEGVAAFQK